MLTLQHYTKAKAWQTLGEPYPASDADRVQQQATGLAHATGVAWRVVGEGGRVLALWDGRRWQTVAESRPMPASYWQQDDDFPDTIPVR